MLPIGRVHELDSRWNDGISVMLMWQPPTDTLIVAVCDTRSGESFELEVAADEALDVFRHPFAYAPRLGPE
jgi:hypothetical protein